MKLGQILKEGHLDAYSKFLLKKAKSNPKYEKLYDEMIDDVRSGLDYPHLYQKYQGRADYPWAIVTWLAKNAATGKETPFRMLPEGRVSIEIYQKGDLYAEVEDNTVKFLTRENVPYPYMGAKVHQFTDNAAAKEYLVKDKWKHFKTVNA